jgi:hypothetical protein
LSSGGVEGLDDVQDPLDGAAVRLGGRDYLLELAPQVALLVDVADED